MCSARKRGGLERMSPGLGVCRARSYRMPYSKVVLRVIAASDARIFGAKCRMVTSSCCLRNSPGCPVVEGQMALD